MNSKSKSKDKPKTSKRRLRRIVLTVGAAVVCWLAYASANILFPSQERSTPDVDAVASLAPQFGRLPTALELFEQTEQSALLISYFAHDAYMETAGFDEEGAPPNARYCNEAEYSGITCFTPEEASTLGEALAIRDIAEAESWESVTVVTSQYHAFRTRLIFDRCMASDVQVNVVYAETDLPVSQWIWHLVYENVAYPKALLETTWRC